MIKGIEWKKMKQELGIYMHIPFCMQKCYYCDFVSFVGDADIQEQYVEVLKKEIIENKEKGNDKIVTTIYIGGGTPSCIDSKWIKNILDTVKKNYIVVEEAEITIEVNPGTVTKEKLEHYKAIGINRLSIGLQSTNNQLLKEIGRIHTYEEFLNTYQLARKVGFTNINVDLMLALPNQTMRILEESLKNVMDLDPEHISIYSLILEERTVLENLVNKGERALIDEQTERDMYWKTKKMLEQNGYIHYEISNFAKPGKESKHNLNCWNQKEYLGFGLAAHSYFNKKRYSNTNDLKKYMKKQEKKIHEIQTQEEQQKEYMMLGLRKIEGVSISEFKKKFVQNPIYLFRKELDKLVKEELLEVDINSIQLTNKGIDLANLVWEEFV